MNLDPAAYRITVVLAPVDMRSGYSRLSSIAAICLGINVDNGQDMVVFISTRRSICKVVWSDPKGPAMLTRRLHQGRFSKFLARIDDTEGLSVSVKEFNALLDGEPLFVQRTDIYSKS